MAMNQAPSREPVEELKCLDEHSSLEERVQNLFISRRAPRQHPPDLFMVKLFDKLGRLNTPTSSSILAVQTSCSVYGALQVHVHETSRVVSGIDTTSGQLIADLIAKVEGKYGFRAGIHQTPGPNSPHVLENARR